MCTAISLTVKDNYFGRNLDFEHSFGEKITITPRKYPFCFENGYITDNHYGIIGMALPKNNYPLYFDATNEKGLSMAGLNFPQYSKYFSKKKGKENIASYELIPFVLCKCKSVKEAKNLISNINITDDAFDINLPPSPLHWIVADKNNAITVEQTDSGMKIYDNKIGVLTNSPSFDIQMFNLKNYMSVSSFEPENQFSKMLDLEPYSRGMGALGLPGDLSSMSRFVKTAFLKLNSVLESNEFKIINHFFHMLYSVYQQKGCVRVGNDFEITHYSSCCNTDKGIYYYTTYNNCNIFAVDLYKENLNAEDLIIFDLKNEQKIIYKN